MLKSLKQLSEIKNLRLSEALKAIAEVSPHINVHLGAKDGSGFIDIAPADEMANPTYLTRLSNKKYRRFAGITDAYRKNLDRIVQNPPDIGGKLGSERYNKWCSEVKTKSESLSKSTTELLSFVPLSDRKILSAYPRILRDGIVLIVSGTELGPYWMAAEKKNKKKAKAATAS